jgi:hypothetical protein
MFPVAEYLAARQRVWRTTSHEEYLTAVTFHYDRNRYAAQDLFRHDALVESRMVQFAVTREDVLLKPIDERRAFGGPPAPAR